LQSLDFTIECAASFRAEQHFRHFGSQRETRKTRDAGED
jgi:hypothetical protein